eukprot:gb/GECG01004557.1/.p1 GENE.gb/GECG01004557.1/~~gb/GECG01004557.1/.p1  ORF type:complete len:176 (+),score=34.27 gb/GECG01004557.1/:1-528(+)
MPLWVLAPADVELEMKVAVGVTSSIWLHDDEAIKLIEVMKLLEGVPDQALLVDDVDDEVAVDDDVLVVGGVTVTLCVLSLGDVELAVEAAVGVRSAISLCEDENVELLDPVELLEGVADLAPVADDVGLTVGVEVLVWVRNDECEDGGKLLEVLSSDILRVVDIIAIGEGDDGIH